jgi:hypothetical protein
LKAKIPHHKVKVWLSYSHTVVMFFLIIIRIHIPTSQHPNIPTSQQTTNNLQEIN